VRCCNEHMFNNQENG